MATTHKLIQTVTLTGTQTGLEFSSIPQTYTDLLIVASMRLSYDSINFALRFNGSSSNFTSRQLYGNGSSAGGNNGSTSDYTYGASNSSAYTANTFSNVQIYIPNYATSNYKPFSMESVNENNATTAYQSITAGYWLNTAAITSVTLYESFVQYSSASLYGIKSS